MICVSRLLSFADEREHFAVFSPHLGNEATDFDALAGVTAMLIRPVSRALGRPGARSVEPAYVLPALRWRLASTLGPLRCG